VRPQQLAEPLQGVSMAAVLIEIASLSAIC